MADICRIMRMGTEKGLWPANEADDGSTFITRTFYTLSKAVDEALNLERDLSHSLSFLYLSYFSDKSNTAIFYTLQ